MQEFIMVGGYTENSEKNKHKTVKIGVGTCSDNTVKPGIYLANP